MNGRPIRHIFHRFKMCRHQVNAVSYSNSKLRPDLNNSAKTKVIEATAPPQQQHKRGTIFATPFNYHMINRHLRIRDFSALVHYLELFCHLHRNLKFETNFSKRVSMVHVQQ